MKYCTHCGSELRDEAVLCPKCGCMVDSYNSVGKNNDNSSGNGFAIAGFVLSFFGGILGIIFSAIGLSKSNKNGGKGKGLAIAGLVVGIVMFVFWSMIFPVIIA